LDVLGGVMLVKGKPEESLALRRQALEATQKRYGPLHAKSLITATQLADGLHQAGFSDEAAALLKSVIADMEKIFDADSPKLVEAQASLCDILTTTRQFAEAAELARKLVLESGPRVYPNNPIMMAHLQNHYGIAASNIGERAEGRHYLELASA